LLLFPGFLSHAGRELDGMLKAGSNAASPVAQGLGLVSDQASQRAEALIGKSVWTDDPDDDEGTLLAEPWPNAIHTLLDATLRSARRNTSLKRIAIFFSRLGAK